MRQLLLFIAISSILLQACTPVPSYPNNVHIKFTEQYSTNAKAFPVNRQVFAFTQNSSVNGQHQDIDLRISGNDTDIQVGSGSPVEAVYIIYGTGNDFNNVTEFLLQKNSSLNSFGTEVNLSVESVQWS